MKIQAGIIVVLLAVSFIAPHSFAETKLWDLQIQVNVENTALYVGDTPIISGQVTDHASNPVPNVQVRVLVGAESEFTSTSEEGYFEVALVDFNGLPGVHVINVMATASDGRMGIQSSNFQVRGDITASSITERRLATDEATRYLNSSREDYTNNPIGLRLFDYYQGLYQKLLEEKQLEKTQNEYDSIMNEKRQITDDTLQAAIELKKPGVGVIKGTQFDNLVSKVGKDNQEIIANQLNYTAFNFIEAKLIMKEILDNGGSMEEARKAYYEKLAIPRSTMEKMSVIQSPIIENVTETNSTSVQNITETNSTQIEITPISYLTINGTNVNLGLDGSTIILNINGTLIKFMINGTELIQITNSTD